MGASRPARRDSDPYRNVLSIAFVKASESCLLGIDVLCQVDYFCFDGLTHYCREHKANKIGH